MTTPINAEKLNILSVKAAEDSKKHGFSDHTKPVYRTLVKAACEVAECVEAYRDSRYANPDNIDKALKNFNIDHKCPGWVQQKYHQTAYNQEAKNTVQDEWADVIIYLLDAAGNISADFTVVKREDIGKHAEFIESHDFVENAGRLMHMLLDVDYFNDTWRQIARCIDFVTVWCDVMLKQDILYWVEHKMMYNKNRPRLHGRNTDPTV